MLTVEKIGGTSMSALKEVIENIQQQHCQHARGIVEALASLLREAN